jgi:hypothetical protein
MSAKRFCRSLSFVHSIAASFEIRRRSFPAGETKSRSGRSAIRGVASGNSTVHNISRFDNVHGMMFPYPQFALRRLYPLLDVSCSRSGRNGDWRAGAGQAGVLPTRLSAVDEAGTMEVLCVDNTGTLTRNELAVTAIVPMPGFDDTHVTALARLASSDAGQDPVDAAIRATASGHHLDDAPKLVAFICGRRARARSSSPVRLPICSSFRRSPSAAA